MMSVILLILATALSGCTGGRGAITSSPPRPAPSRTAVQPATPTRATESPEPTTSPAANQTRAATTATPEVTEGAIHGPPDTERFTPVTGDVAFVRRGSLWLADLDGGEEQMVVPNPHAEQGWNPIAGHPVWHPGGRWLAYLSYYPEDLAARRATDRAYVTFVDLEEGVVWRRLDLQASVHGGLAWHGRHPVLAYVGADADAHPLPRSDDERLSGRRVYYPFDASSHLLQVTAPDGDPQSVLQETASDEAYTGPVAYIDSDRYRYVHLYRDGAIEIKELDARSGLTETVGSLSLHFVNQPYSVPTLGLPNDSSILVLVHSPATGTAVEDEGLYRVTPGTGETEHIVRLSGGCGLTAGSWEGHVALGCGAAETAPLLICDVAAGSCDDLALTLLDDIEALIVPEDVPLNAIKLRPIQWSREGDLYIVATAYAAGQPWSGDGHLLKVDVGAATVSLVLERADGVAISAIPIVARPTDVASSDCEDMERPALVMASPPAERGTERAFVLVTPDGEEQCRLNPAYVPWSSTECQVVGERVVCWAEEQSALQILDVVSGEVETVEPELEREEAPLDFLVSANGEQIVWSTTDTDGGDADGPEDTSRCRVSISEADGSDMRTVVEETTEKPYHLTPVTWTPDGAGILFARMRVWVESGGAFIPTFSGRYSELFRLDLASRELRKVFPLDDAAVCNRCIGDVSPDGHWLAYHRDDGSLVLRDMVNREETLVADGSSACYLGRARLSPDGRHLVYVEMEGPCDEEDSFEAARTVMVDAPFEGQSRVLAESSAAVDWPVGWLDGETPIFDRVYKGFDHRGLWLAGHSMAGHSSAAEDLLPGILIGVVQPSPTGTSEGASDQ